MEGTTSEEMARAQDHAWSWFSLHSTQRLNMFNYWLVATAFLTTAYVAASNGRPSSSIGLVVALAGAFTSFSFHRLDRRSRKLVAIAEKPLRELEEILAKSTGVGSLRMIDAAATSAHWYTRYGQVIDLVQLVAVFAFLGAAVAAF